MTMPTFAKALIATGCMVLAAPLTAQDAGGGESDDTIVVTGQAEGEVDSGEAREQARAITPRGGVIGEPLARFQQPVCPGVWGLSGESAQLIIDRIYHNAEAIGLDLSTEPGCTANIVVAFVADPDAELEDLIASQHPMVSGLTFWERKRLREQEGPVRAWNVVSTRTRDGQGRNGRPPVFDSTMISRTESGTRRDIEVSAVMIEASAIAEIDGVAVADYATMRTLARTLPPGEGEVSYGTILSLFANPDTAPDRMTDFDLAYLTSLYRGRANTPGRMALRNVDELM